MKHFFAIILGKFVRFIMKKRGGGSALPGLIVERICPNFLTYATKGLPYGVVVISGTNGKTTTTKTVVALLEAQGLNVFTNRTGSNFVRGVIAASLDHISLKGTINADIAVLELDEAHALHFIKNVPPRYALLLNVLRDQLDRFGELDTTASFLQQIATTTTNTVVVNCNDQYIGTESFIKNITANVHGYAVDDTLVHEFATDSALHTAHSTHKPLATSTTTTLTEINGSTINITYPNQTSAVISTQFKGIYNLQNATGALALVWAILGDKMDIAKNTTALSLVQPAFGRGEVIEINGQPLELLLVKNPSGFKLSLQSNDPNTYATMIAINDEFADGRDMSWLWDVSFTALGDTGVTTVSGTRAYDMTLRLMYDEVSVEHTEPHIEDAVDTFIAKTPDTPRQIFCTYTSMLAIRNHLRTYTTIEDIT